jgi:hypothetical protein
MSSICFAEQIAVLPDGKKIIVFDNGTWKAEESVKPILSVFDSSCSALTEIKTDKVTGKTSTTNKEPIIITKDDKNGIVINIIKFSEGLILSIKAIGAGNCIDEGDKIYVLFSDKSKLELASDGDFNCDSKATIYFGGVFGKKAQLRELLAKRIETIRVWTNNSFVEEDFTKENADAFYYTLRCLAN